MKIGIISFTEKGEALARTLPSRLTEHRVELRDRSLEGAKDWVKGQVSQGTALVFVGACGIAVRMIAPYVRDKLTDGPVLVMDELGRYVIPILSGHVGGANELSRLIADRMGAIPIITTATDLNERFAVDLFAKKNGLRIMNREGIASVSSKVLRGEVITISIEGYEERQRYAGGKISPEVRLVSYPPADPVDVVVARAEKQAGIGSATLFLSPREYVVGMGCRRGKSKEELASFLNQGLREAGIGREDLYCVSSIDRKKDEPGLQELAEECRIPFLTFSEEALRQVKGAVQGSAFVERVVGVDNVCERSALAASGEKSVLILGKQAKDGMTMAIGKRNWKIRWEEETDGTT